MCSRLVARLDWFRLIRSRGESKRAADKVPQAVREVAVVGMHKPLDSEVCASHANGITQQPPSDGVAAVSLDEVDWVGGMLSALGYLRAVNRQVVMYVNARGEREPSGK